MNAPLCHPEPIERVLLCHPEPVEGRPSPSRPSPLPVHLPNKLIKNRNPPMLVAIARFVRLEVFMRKHDLGLSAMLDEIERQQRVVFLFRAILFPLPRALNALGLANLAIDPADDHRSPWRVHRDAICTAD